MLGKFGNKQPYEEYYLKFNFSEDMAEADSVSTIAAVVTTLDDDETDVSTTMLDATQDYSVGANAYVWIKGGTDAQLYLVTCKILTATLGEKYELEGSILVMEIS